MAPNYTDIQGETELHMNRQLLKEVYRATPHPKFIRDLASEFIRTELQGKRFIGMHFRYNPGDFFDREFEKFNASDDKHPNRGLPKLVAFTIQKALKEPDFLMKITKKYNQRHFLYVSNFYSSFMDNLIRYAESMLPAHKNDKIFFPQYRLIFHDISFNTHGPSFE